MWPEKGSGFEASSFSPAGRAQQMSAFAQGAAYDDRARRGCVLVLYAAFAAILIVLVVTVIVALI
ncbi:MAG: hypothetical protein QOF21_2883 [Actinomycetota bacterium]